MKLPFHTRFRRYGRTRRLDCILWRYKLSAEFSSLFDRRGSGERAMAFISVETRRGARSILIQRYTEGYRFDLHTDGSAHNHVISWQLWRASRGGEFFIEGPMCSWLGGRLIAFDGCYPHGVTTIEQGSRVVVMFQHQTLD